ncbi:MAG TPA: hypothetical protein VF142_20450 [Longimicrobium sp.]
MKRIIVCAVLALLSACALPTGDDGTVVRLDQAFTLSEGRTALVLGPRIAVEFIDVVEDQRCPIEALCISAGNATVRVRVAQEGWDPAVLELRTDQPGTYKVYNYHAVELLELDPPASTREPDPDYRAKLRVYPVFTTGG